MKGSVRKRGKSYTITLDTGVDPISGKRKQHTETHPVMAFYEISRKIKVSH